MSKGSVADCPVFLSKESKVDDKNVAGFGSNLIPLGFIASHWDECRFTLRIYLQIYLLPDKSTIHGSVKIIPIPFYVRIRNGSVFIGVSTGQGEMVRCSRNEVFQETLSGHYILKAQGIPIVKPSFKPRFAIFGP